MKHFLAENTGDDLKGDKLTLSDIVDGKLKPRRFNGSWISGKKTFFFYNIYILIF